MYNFLLSHGGLWQVGKISVVSGIALTRAVGWRGDGSELIKVQLWSAVLLDLVLYLSGNCSRAEACNETLWICVTAHFSVFLLSSLLWKASEFTCFNAVVYFSCGSCSDLTVVLKGIKLSYPCSDRSAVSVILQHDVQRQLFCHWEKLLMKVASETFFSGSEDEIVIEINVDLQPYTP